MSKLSSAIKFKSPLTLLRAVSHELRYAIPKKRLLKNQGMIYILDQYRKHEVTDERVCRSDAELQFIMETYHCYLKSSRQYQHLHQTYYGNGERSVEDTAKIMGFTLPKNE